MNQPVNVLKVGATRKGKTLSAVADAVNSPDEAALIVDPHNHSLAEAYLTHATGNLLFDRLSEIHTTLGYEFLSPMRGGESQAAQRKLQAFVAILLRRRGADGMASAPLMEEWVTALLLLWMYQRSPQPLALLPYGFLPNTEEFRRLVRGCVLPDVRAKFEALEGMKPRSLRSEVGSASRLVNAVFRSPAFKARSRGGFDLGGFLQEKGKLVVERGDEIDDDAMRVIMGALVLLVIDHAKRRQKPFPRIRIYIDEATNARLVGEPELNGLAETNKNGLYYTILVQNLDFPGGSDAVLQNCHRHEWFGCPHYDLARKAATDVESGLPPTEESRAERIARLTTEIMNLPAGWRWVKDRFGSRKEYVPMLENPWPAWPGLREEKLCQKLSEIYARPEYRKTGERSSPPTSEAGTLPPSSWPDDSSPADRLKRKRTGRRPADGSESSDGGSGSE